MNLLIVYLLLTAWSHCPSVIFSILLAMLLKLNCHLQMHVLSLQLSYVCVYTHKHMKLLLCNVKSRSPKDTLAQKTNGCECIHSGACFINLEGKRINVVSLYSVTCLDILYITINIRDVFWVLVQVYALTQW